MRCFILISLLLSLCQTPVWSETPRAEAGWSSALLREVLDVGTVRKAGVASNEGFVLKSYQLRHLRLGEPGRARSAVQLMQRLLPEGSALREDVAANSLHLLSSPAAHAAVWDFISAVDLPAQTTTPVTARELPSELREALAKIEGLRESNGQVAGQLEQLRGALGQGRGVGERSTLLLAVAGSLLLLLLISGVGFWRLRREIQSQAPVAAVREESSVQLVQSLVQGSLVPAQKALQNEMMGVLNAAAIRMEAWYNEQKARGEALERATQCQQESLALAQAALLDTREQLRADNERMIEKMGSRMDASTGRLDENVRALGDQHRRVEALAGELQSTVRELDETKDTMLRLQQELEAKRGQLDETKQSLGRREADLVRQQAKLAALTLILEEGAWPGSAASMETAGVDNDINLCAVGAAASEAQGNTEFSKEKSCTVQTSPNYIFLPPEHPEA